MNSDEIIVVMAKGPGKPWFREKYTPSAWFRMIGEKFSDSYRDQMEKLREIDDQIREWAKDLDDCLKKAKQAFSERRHLDVAHWIAQINDRLKMILKDGKELEAFEKLNLKEYYNQYQDADIFENYFDEPQLETKAGFLDGLGRMLSGRQLEKNNAKAIKEKRQALRILLEHANTLVIRVFEYLNEMGKFRAKGDLSQYLVLLNKIGTLQQNFQKDFKNVYDKHILPIIQEIRKQKEDEDLKTKNWLVENKRLEEERIKNLEKEKSPPVEEIPEYDVDVSELQGEKPKQKKKTNPISSQPKETVAFTKIAQEICDYANQI